MTSSRLWVAVCLGCLIVTCGCRSALREPPPVDEMGTGSGHSSAQPEDPSALIARAGLEFERRPDIASVERAQALYLEAARNEAAPAEAFLGAAVATAWLIEHEDDDERRGELAVEGVQIGQHCVRLFPDVAECTYRLALAVGQQARELPSTALDGLGVMVELLQEVIETAPELDLAGGDRVLALVLLRAPGWPTGPGDPEAAMSHAAAAVDLFPRYPPNQLVLAEALRANAHREEARRAYQRAAEVARLQRETGVPEATEWLAEAEAALAESW